MSQEEKLLLNVLRGTQDKNIPFLGLQKLLGRLGFNERIRGDHYIYTRPEVAEIINIQPNGHLAKPYQVKQVRDVIIKYHMGGDQNV